MSNYNPVTPAFIDKLRDIVGAEFVFTDAETLDKYKTDEETDERCFHLPDVVIAPANAEEIAAVMKLCNEFLIPVISYGLTIDPCAGSTKLMLKFFQRDSLVHAKTEEHELFHLFIAAQPGNTLHERL